VEAITCPAGRGFRKDVGEMRIPLLSQMILIGYRPINIYLFPVRGISEGSNPRAKRRDSPSEMY